MIRRTEGVTMPKETGSRENIFGCLNSSRELAASSDAREFMKSQRIPRSSKGLNEIKGIGRYLRYLVNPYISSDVCGGAGSRGYHQIPEETCGYVPTVSF